MLLIVHLNVKVICKPFVVTLVAVLMPSITLPIYVLFFVQYLITPSGQVVVHVEPVITTCSGELSYTLPAAPHSTCSYRELQSRLSMSEVLCAPSLVGDIKSLFDGYMGCVSFLQFVLESCSLDANSDFCSATDEPDEDFNEYIILIQTNCRNIFQSCVKVHLKSF